MSEKLITRIVKWIIKHLLGEAWSEDKADKENQE